MPGQKRESTVITLPDLMAGFRNAFKLPPGYSLETATFRGGESYERIVSGGKPVARVRYHQGPYGTAGTSLEWLGASDPALVSIYEAANNQVFPPSRKARQ